MPARLVKLLLLAIVGVALVSCGDSAPGAGSSKTPGDAPRGPGEVRIAALSPAIAHMLVGFGLEDRIVARHDHDLVLSERVPAVGSQDGIDYEALLSAHPTDVLVEWGARPLPDRLTELAARQGWVVRNYGSITTIDDIARVLDDVYFAYAPDRTEAANGADIVQDPQRLDPTARLARARPSDRLADAWLDRGPRVRRAGRVLLLAELKPASAVGPTSFHQQILERIGGVPAITDGGAWQELDAEDVLRLAPDAIVLILPRQPGPDEAFEAPRTPTADELIGRLGVIGELDIPAIRDRRVALIDNPLSHLPSTSMADFADELAAILEAWGRERSDAATSPGRTRTGP